MIKRVVIPPYDKYGISTFVIHDNTVYIGHFGGVCDLNGNVLTSIEQQTEQTLNNLEKSLKEIGLTLENVVKLNVLLKKIEDFHNMHCIWTKYFTNNSPVRTVLTTQFVSDKCLIQIEGVACIN